MGDEIHPEVADLILILKTDGMEEILLELISHRDCHELAITCPRYYRTLRVKAPWNQEFCALSSTIVSTASTRPPLQHQILNPSLEPDGCERIQLH